MVRGQYIAGTGMILQRRLMENITNNITNADTTGYKKDHLVAHSFDDVLIRRINDPDRRGNSPVIGPLNFGAQVDQIYTDFTTGNFESTERTTDMAIAGRGFFVVDTPAGERYTRSGAFYLNRDGYIVDADGNYLLGTNGRIRVTSGEFSVSSDGRVYDNGQEINTVRIVDFADETILRKQGNSLFSAPAGSAQAAAGFEVKQGFLENSNVDISREMVDMITVYRTYETNQRMLTMIDETVGKAVNDIGRLR